MNSSTIIQTLTNKVIELVMIELGKADMRANIQNKIIHPLLFMIYKQLYPYIYGFCAIIFLMFIMLVVLIIFFIMYLKK